MRGTFTESKRKRRVPARCWCVAKSSKIEPRRNLLEDHLIRLRAIELERFPRGQTRLERDFVFHAERELALERDGLVFDFRLQIFRRGRDRDPARDRFRRDLLGQRLGKFDDDAAARDPIAFRRDAADHERLHRADDDFFARGQGHFPFRRGQPRLDDQLPVLSREEAA